MELHGPLDFTGELICPRSWVGVVFSLFMEKRLCRVRLTFSAAECHSDFVFRLQTTSHNLTIFHVDTTLLDFLLVDFFQVRLTMVALMPATAALAASMEMMMMMIPLATCASWRGEPEKILRSCGRR